MSIPLHLALAELPPTNSSLILWSFQEFLSFPWVEIGRSSVSIPLYAALTELPSCLTTAAIITTTTTTTTTTTFTNTTLKITDHYYMALTELPPCLTATTSQPHFLATYSSQLSAIFLPSSFLQGSVYPYFRSTLFPSRLCFIICPPSPPNYCPYSRAHPITYLLASPSKILLSFFSMLVGLQIGSISPTHLIQNPNV